MPSRFTSWSIALGTDFISSSADLPFDISPSSVQPVYEDLKGWGVDLTGMREETSLPTELSHYIAYLEDKLETPITVVSVGPDRKQTIERKLAFA
jgi:adenylosuccinate synthase